jgi:beta-lactamase class A
MPANHDSWPRLHNLLESMPNAGDVCVAAVSLTTGERYGHQADLVMSSASTIKTLILVALARAVDNGRLELTTRVPVLPQQLAGGSGILNELQTPLELSLADHAHLMITISDNTASNVLIDAVGMDAIGATADALGLKGTALQRRFLGRLPDPGTPENLTSAADLVRILTAISDGTAASPDQCTWMLERLGAQHYLNRLPRYLPGGVSFGGKSGSLEGFDHDCGIFSGPGGKVAMAVLVRNVTDTYAADATIGALGQAAIADAALAHAGGS